MHLGFVLAGLVLVAGCASSATDAPPTEATTIGGTCPAEVSAAAAATIRAQQTAFASGDFAKARSYASAGFQSVIEVPQFEEIIVMRYGFLLDDPNLEFLTCDLVDEQARMSVRVAVSPERMMTYRLVREGADWRIDGATTPSEPSAITT